MNATPQQPATPERPAAPQRWSRAVDDPDMWLDTAEDPREDGLRHRGEHAVLTDYLRRYRTTLELKCDGLDAEQLARRSVPPSTMSLLGLVRHMAEVERHWFQRRLAGREAPPRYISKTEPDADFDGAVADPEVVDQAWRAWREEVASAEEYLADHTDLDAADDTGLEMRDVLVHMIEEYARHCGHADLLRERIDGRVGQ